MIYDPMRRALELREQILESMSPQERAEYLRECLRSQPVEDTCV